MIVRDKIDMNTSYRFDHRNIPLTSILLGLGFLVIGSISILEPTLFGFPWMIILGLILMGVGVEMFYRTHRSKEDVKNALESYNRVSMKQLASELNMNRKNLTSAIVDLRNNGEIMARIDYSRDKVMIETRNH